VREKNGQVIFLVEEFHPLVKMQGPMAGEKNEKREKKHAVGWRQKMQPCEMSLQMVFERDLRFSYHFEGDPSCAGRVKDYPSPLRPVFHPFFSFSYLVPQ